MGESIRSALVRLHSGESLLLHPRGGYPGLDRVRDLLGQLSHRPVVMTDLDRVQLVEAPPGAGQPVLAFHSAGSTGSPKCVVYDADVACAHADAIAARLHLARSDDLHIALAPPNFAYGLSIAHSHLHAGVPVTFLPATVGLGAVADTLSARGLIRSPYDTFEPTPPGRRDTADAGTLTADGLIVDGRTDQVVTIAGTQVDLARVHRRLQDEFAPLALKVGHRTTRRGTRATVELVADTPVRPSEVRDVKVPAGAAWMGVVLKVGAQAGQVRTLDVTGWQLSAGAADALSVAVQVTAPAVAEEPATPPTKPRRSYKTFLPGTR